jgi:hypothetical protein
MDAVKKRAAMRKRRITETSLMLLQIRIPETPKAHLQLKQWKHHRPNRRGPSPVGDADVVVLVRRSLRKALLCRMQQMPEANYLPLPPPTIPPR